MKWIKYCLSAVLIASLFFLTVIKSPGSEKTKVRMWKDSLVLPTYLVGESEVLPVYKSDAYQGAARSVYPYPYMDHLTGIKKEKEYKGLFLENEYIKLCVLPELGGRIFYAQDKTNGYDLFYRQSVIKPCLIGMIGAWIAGGVEWNFPHHHRVTTFMPVDYRLEKNEDQSKTIWIGEFEYRHRIKWTLGLTLYPGKSYIEVSVKLFNRTPFEHSMLFWTNAAVHANDQYQVIFPPGTEYATYHAKTEFTPWPVPNKIYRGIDFTDSVDVSWYRNHKSGTSFFAWQAEDDFIAGYDHRAEAGVVHVSNHHIAPGKKLWTWGKNPRGQAWQRIYTDDDGPYIEIMAGAYSDNQPDYSWIQPYEVRTFKEYWYPLKKMGGVKKANRNAAINLEVLSENNIRIAANTSAAYNNATLELLEKENILFEEIIDISPSEPYMHKITLQKDVHNQDLRMLLLSEDGNKLIYYRPPKKEESPIPEPVEPPLPPEKIENIEELYLIGQRLEQFHNPSLDPRDYYLEALSRDPGYSQANTALGILHCRRGRYQKAEERLKMALKRITHRYTHPKTGKAHYYLGLSLRKQGNHDSAFDAFYKAAWCQDVKAAAYYQLAELASIRGNYSEALKLVNRSLDVNRLNKNANDLKATLLRKLNRFQEAREAALSMLDLDPLDFRVKNELYMVHKEMGATQTALEHAADLKTTMRDNDQSYLELAVEYGNCGLWDEAIQILSRRIKDSPGDSVFPMLHYFKGYYLDKKGLEDRAVLNDKLASNMPPAYCFPFRLESIEVLEEAIKKNPGNASARYYLANLLFNIQPQNDSVLRLWKKSAALDSSFFIAHRNIGMFYKRIKKDYQKAISSYEKAIDCNPNVARLFFELDELYEAVGVSPKKRLAFLQKHKDVTRERHITIAREITLHNLMGHYEKAIALMRSHQFHVWEGGGDIRTAYRNAHLLLGLQCVRNREYRKARRYFQESMDYPENLQVWKRKKGIQPKVDYLIGTVHDASGNSEKAETYYRKSVSYDRNISALSYYQGMAWRKLGRDKKAEKIFKQLIEVGRERLEKASTIDFFAKFGTQQSVNIRKARARYLIGLGYLGMEQPNKAEEEFRKVRRLNINHLWAKAQLEHLE